MSQIHENIKFLRKQLGLTQEQLSEKIGIKRSVIGAYEEGRAEPGVGNLMLFASFFKVSVDELISENLKKGDKGEVEIKGKGVNAEKLKILSITVDNENKENIHLVPYKAAAGYLSGYADPEYIAELPRLYLPIFPEGSYRAFEIRGDSMLPIVPGSIIVGGFVENWDNIKQKKTYVVVTQNEGIVYKRLVALKEKQSFLFVSDNTAYPPYEINEEDISEIWEAKAFISTEFPSTDGSMQTLNEVVSELKEEVKKLKNGKTSM